MKRGSQILITVLVLACMAFAQAADIKGDWAMTVETQQGPIPITLKFTEVDPEQIKGTIESPQGALEIKGKLTGEKIAFAGVFETGNGPFQIIFTGTVNGTKMSGNADFGPGGSASWTAEKSH